MVTLPHLTADRAFAALIGSTSFVPRSNHAVPLSPEYADSQVRSQELELILERRPPLDAVVLQETSLRMCIDPI